MTDTPAPTGTAWSPATRGDTVQGGGHSAARGSGHGGADDGWSQPTNVRSGAARAPVHTPSAPSRSPEPPRPARPTGPERRPSPSADEWAPAGPLPSRDQRAARRAERVAEPTPQSPAQQGFAVARPRERGLPWWAALLVLIVIAAIGGVIDVIGSINVKGGFNIGIVVASVVAILIVKRSHMFPIVIAPPIVYSLAALFQLYVRSSGLHDKKVVLDAAANYLVYGFPAIAAATAAVLIIAGIRLIIRK